MIRNTGEVYRDASQELDEHDGAVGALLIGEALIDHCQQAVARARAPQETEPHDRWRAIGDLHDTYPDIWRHLDRARKVLAARGANTAAYDELRPHARRAASDPGIDGDRVPDTRALEDASRALEELKLGVPGADWDAIAARTQGLVRAPLSRRRRQRLGLAGVIGAFSIAVAIWMLAIVPVHKPDPRDMMRDELRVVEQQRKLRISSLVGAIGERCAQTEAQELVRLLVLDGRGLDARSFASDYSTRCGADSVIDHWAHAPLPRR